ncbi:hypothetical protein HK096_009762, partial [Nowakowskiella sp. JEL0078]
FALNPIGHEVYNPDSEHIAVPNDSEAGGSSETQHLGKKPLGYLLNPKHPFNIVANIILNLLLLFGWHIAIAHVALAIVQATTIFGIGNALTNISLVPFALWPFGRAIRKKDPTPFPNPV